MFGSKYYIRGDVEDLEKFDTKVDEGIFLCYYTKIKSYICYNKRVRRMVERTNVKVNEDILKNIFK